MSIQYRTPVGPTLAENCGGSALFVFMTIVEAYLRKENDLDDPRGRATPRFRNLPDRTYDFVVIGGGTAGAVAASRLSEISDWKVLLIEAGEDEPVGSQVPSMLTYFGSSIDWSYNTEKENGACLASEGICYWPRGKVLGGTSVLNGMMYIRGNPEDYDNWEEMGNDGWSFKDVLPYFKKSEDNLESYRDYSSSYHAKGGLLPVSRFTTLPLITLDILDGAGELNMLVKDLNGDGNTGFTIAQTTSKNGSRYSTARAFLRPARDRQNLHILVNTTASRVLIDPSTKKVQGVEIVYKNGEKRQIRVAKEVVVSGGAVNSPQILLLSGIGPKEDLIEVGVTPVHHLPGVGKNLHNHVSYSLKYTINEPDINPLSYDTLNKYINNRGGLMASTGLSSITGKIASPYADQPGVPDVQYYFGGYMPTCSKTGANDDLLSVNLRTISISPAVLHPKSRGYLTLASNDPLQHPLIVANYLTDKRDVKVLISAIRFANKLANTTSLQKHGMELDRTPIKGCETLHFDTDSYWECAIRQNTEPENHQAGSCKMGSNCDPMAVVDHRLEVHGIQGLRVMDTSIMPEVTSGNTMAPAIMIAEKGVDMIKEDYGWIKPVQKPTKKDLYNGYNGDRGYNGFNGYNGYNGGKGYNSYRGYNG